jgi:hypothetical protein
MGEGQAGRLGGGSVEVAQHRAISGGAYDALAMPMSPLMVIVDFENNDR